jgi:hypothetical protein
MSDAEQDASIEQNLEAIEGFLAKSEFECLLDEVESFKYLLVGLGVDEQDRDYVLRLNFINIPNIGGEQESHLPNYTLLQFFLPLPFDADPHHRNEVLRVIARMNLITEFPGFSYNEQRSEVLFRYVHFSCEERMKKAWLITMLLYMRSVIDMFADLLERVCTGEATYESLMKEFEDQLASLKKTK